MYFIDIPWSHYYSNIIHIQYIYRIILPCVVLLMIPQNQCLETPTEFKSLGTFRVFNFCILREIIFKAMNNVINCNDYEGNHLNGVIF